MNDLELLRLIRERRAELARAELAALGPIDDSMRAHALQMLVEKAERDPECAARLGECTSMLGEGFRAFVVDMTARQEKEEDSPNSSDQEPFSEGGAEPEEERAISTRFSTAELSAVARVQHEEPNTDHGRYLPPVQPRQPGLPLPWYEDSRPRPGLQRANELKRRLRKPEPADTGPNRGSGWMKR